MGGLRTYGLTQEPSWQAIQQQWMQRFRDFAIKAQYRTETLRYSSAPTRPEPLVCLKRVKCVRGRCRRVSHPQVVGLVGACLVCERMTPCWHPVLSLTAAQRVKGAMYSLCAPSGRGSFRPF